LHGTDKKVGCQLFSDSKLRFDGSEEADSSFTTPEPTPKSEALWGP